MSLHQIFVNIIVQHNSECIAYCLSMPHSLASVMLDNLFNGQLRVRTASKFLMLCRDWNGHVGRTGSDYKEIHGGCGYGDLDPDIEGETIE